MGEERKTLDIFAMSNLSLGLDSNTTIPYNAVQYSAPHDYKQKNNDMELLIKYSWIRMSW